MLKLYVIAKDKLAAARKFFAKKEEGASLVEYGLLVGLIAVVCVTAVAALGTKISDMFTNIAATMPST
jgi:pilus assembly protein Flp/PilA